MLFLCVVLTLFAGQVCAAPAENADPLEGAAGLWHFAGGAGSVTTPFDHEISGGVEFYPLPAGEAEESRKRGGDGNAALLQGGYLLLNTYRARRFRPDGDELTLYVRARLEGPPQEGTFFYSDFLSLGVYPCGTKNLAVAFIGARVPGGKNYREVPLALLRGEGWTDLTLTAGNGSIAFWQDGVRLACFPLTHGLAAPFDDDLVLGGFRCLKPDTYETGEPFARFREAAIDTAALWHRVLEPARISALCGGKRLSVKSPDRFDKAVAACNAFYDASCRRSEADCRDAWKVMADLAAEDPARPLWHLTQPFGTIFDPCGAFYYGGRYHVFSYHSIRYTLKYSSLDHYASPDLLHWTGLPIAPMTDADCDVFCIYLLNHFIDDKGDLRALYTAQGKNGKTGVLARSDDGMLSYTDKHTVIGKYHHDGHVFRHNGVWYTITSRLSKGMRPGNLGDPVMLWSSPDLENWREEGEIFCARKDNGTGGFMEFPYLLFYGDRDVLILGGHPVKYWVGRFDWETLKFIPEHEEGMLLDVVSSFHCFNPLCVDDKGPGGSERRLIMALFPGLNNSGPGLLPWACCHAMPRVLTFNGERLCQEPAPEFEALRGPATDTGTLTLRGEYTAATECKALEMSVSFHSLKGRAGLRFLLEDGSEAVAGLDPADGSVGIAGAASMTGSGPGYFSAGDRADLRIFVDRQLLEVFVNGQTCTTSLNSGIREIRIFSDDTAPLSATVWQLSGSALSGVPLSDR
ncbi:MAG: glycoside hydrolase family 32 protein [Abditibacteriota bacterium]|nr:glycoside hydrolase family 32 protein [Abditibacteriota bacterium]